MAPQKITGIQSAEVKVRSTKGRVSWAGTATEVDLNHEFDSLHILIVIDGVTREPRTGRKRVGE